MVPQNVDKWKYWACRHVGERGSKRNTYSCGHSVITCPKCEGMDKEDCPLPGCCSKTKTPTSAMLNKKKSMKQDQQLSDNFFYLILPPDVVLTLTCVA